MKKQKITRIKCSYSLLQTIKILREKSHLNRDEISLQMGKARNYISNLENGKNEYIKINDFRNLIKILLPQITFELTDENLVLIEKAINENHGHIENVLMDINNIDVLRLNRELLVSELDKQLIYRKLADVEEIFYDKVDRECNLPKDTMYKIITGERKPVAGEFGVNLKCELQPDLVYTSLKKVFTYLDFIIPAKLDTYLNMLGVVVPNIANVEKIDNLNVCYKTDVKKHIIAEKQCKFTKLDLKTGDLILRADGVTGIVNRELGTIITKNDWVDLDNYNADLTYLNDESAFKFDILEVRRPLCKSDCQFNVFDRELGLLVYEREKVEEMTLEEVCKLLGKKIKIVEN